MKKVYIVCRNNEFEKTLCLEYAKVHELEVFKISYPESEEEKKAAVCEVLSLVQDGNIDVFLYFAPILLSNYQEWAIDRIIEIIKTGIMVEMAYFCLPQLYDQKRYENELLPLLLNLPNSIKNDEKKDTKVREPKTAYVVHDGSALYEDMCNRYVKMNSLNVIRTSCPKSEKQKIAVLKEVFNEVLSGNIDTVIFAAHDIISKNTRIALEMVKQFAAARVDTVICFFEMFNIYDEDAWNTEVPRLIAEDKKRRLRKGG